MGRYIAAQRPSACPNASVPADRQSTGCGVERDARCPLILGQLARRLQRPSPRLSARCSERVAFAPPLPRKLAPSRPVGVDWSKTSKLRTTEIKAGVSVTTQNAPASIYAVSGTRHDRRRRPCDRRRVAPTAIEDANAEHHPVSGVGDCPPIRRRCSGNGQSEGLD